MRYTIMHTYTIYLILILCIITCLPRFVLRGTTNYKYPVVPTDFGRFCIFWFFGPYYRVRVGGLASFACLVNVVVLLCRCVALCCCFVFYLVVLCCLSCLLGTALSWLCMVWSFYCCLPWSYFNAAIVAVIPWPFSSCLLWSCLLWSLSCLYFTARS